MTIGNKRLNILTVSEIKEIFAFSRFTPKDREFYISLDEEEMIVVESFTTLKSKVYFILLSSYFRATGIFHNFEFQNVKRDTKYVLNKYFPGKKVDLIGNPWKKIRLDQRKKILELYQFQPWDEKAVSFFYEKALKLLRLHANHIDVFMEVVDLLRKKRIVLAPYRTLQDLLSKAMGEEKLRLKKILDREINSQLKTALNNLLEKDDSVMNLSLLKAEAKNFKHGELSGEAQKCKNYRSLYLLAKETIPKLELSGRAIRQYAEMVEQLSIFRLRQINASVAKCYLLCFIYCRYQQINDNLILGLIYHVEDFNKKRKDFAKEKLLKYNLEQNEVLPGVSKLLKLMVNDDYPDNLYFKKFLDGVAFSILPKNRFVSVADFISGKGFDSEKFKWDYCEKASQTFKMNIRPLFLNISFASNNKENELFKAINFLKDAVRIKMPLNQIPYEDFPDTFIPKNMKKYIKEVTADNAGKNIVRYNADKYEFLVYQQAVKHLDHETLFCHDTLKNKCLKDDLLPEDIWKNKKHVLGKIEYVNIITPIEKRLKDLEQKLHNKILDVNRRIQEGKNKEFKKKFDRKQQEETWSLSYVGQKETNNGPLFRLLPQVSVADIIYYINDHCRFLKAFTHIRPKYSKQPPNENVLIAAITANAFSYGSYKMAQMSNISYDILQNIDENYLRMETLKTANDIIVNETANQPIFSNWNITPDKLFGSVDGQKFETRIHTLQARYSKKYFGRNKGVVDNSLNVNHLSVNSNLIGANEQEHSYVFDLVYNNTSEIDPGFITGDMHTINKLNFVFLDAINKDFIPNYKNIRKSVEGLCCFNSLDDYKNCFIKPKHVVDSKIIVEQQDYIQHVNTSLVLQDVTQSIIVKKLNSTSGQSRLKKALWEYNRIFMSLNILDYIDNSEMRSNIRKTLNRIEAYHQLRRTITKVHTGKFRGVSTVEIKIWNQCSRLISNCIILYNAIILSGLLKSCDGNEAEIMRQKLRLISPVSWTHINLNGQYDFRRRMINLNISEMVNLLKNHMKNEKQI